MKIKETLTIQQTVSLINGETVGIFNSMITSEDSYNSLKYDLCLGYYMERSGDKPISQTYKRLMQLKNQNPTIVDTADDLLGKIIRNKFSSKWSKQYLALLQEQYNPLVDYEHSETITKDNTDITTYATTIENSGNRGSKVTTTFEDNSNDKVYGFNSTSTVDTDVSNSTSTETSQGLATDNTTNNTEEKSGTDTKSHIADERKNISGRNLTVAELIDKELDMRNRQIFFDIVYEDIDSIATIGVYTYEPDEYNPIKEYVLTDLAIDSNGVYLAVNYGADGFARITVNVEPPLQDKEANENGIVTADNGYYGLRRVNVQVEGEPPSVLVPLDVEINNVTFLPTTFNADGFSEVRVNIPETPPKLQVKEWTFENNNVGKVFIPDEGYDGLSEVRVSVEVPETEFNISYGNTEPTDTSKLWIKTDTPEAARVVSKVEGGSEELEVGVATLPSKGFSIASAAVGTKVYLFGGHDNSGTRFKTINVFNTDTNTITTLSATLPTGAEEIAAAAVGTKVYLFGGFPGYGSGLNTINVFDTDTNTITTLSKTLPTAASQIAAATVGTKIYLFGGNGSSPLNTINVFDTETNTITTLSTRLPTAARAIAAAAVGTKVYLFGGSKSSGKLNTINVFDTETNTITTLSTTLPTSATTITSAAVGTKVYLFGGFGESALNTINVFDTESNTITTLSTTLPTAAYCIASAAVGTKVYLFGGFGSSGILTTINAFVAALALAANNMLIEASTTKNIFNLLSTVELGVNAIYLGNADGVAETVAAALYVDGVWVDI